MSTVTENKPPSGSAERMPAAAESMEWYRRMLLIRAFEERLDRLFGDGELRGTTHFCIGQEASAMGACAALQRGDYVTSTHRGHGHALACGADPGQMMAEIFGRSGGYCQGKGGTQHMAALEIGFLGSNGITGGGIPIATGAAFSSKLRKTGRIALCFFGEGAANQGSFHECLNMAGLWKLPILYCCENNQYAMGTAAGQSFARPDIAGRAPMYGMNGQKVDGNDLLAVYSTVSEAAYRARSGAGPTLIEIETYRWRGHSRSDARHYRTREEEEEWRLRDPIERWRTRMKDAGILTELNDETLRTGVESEMDRAVEFARESPVLEEGLARSGAYREAAQ